MPVRTIDDKTSDTLVVVPGEGFWTGSSTLPHLHQYLKSSSDPNEDRTPGPFACPQVCWRATVSPYTPSMDRVVRRGRLPDPLTPLVGRDADMREVERLLGEHRLVTLTGAGGSGKTRVAIAVASRGDDATFVALEDAHDIDAVVVQVADSLGITERLGTDLPATVESYLAGHRMLLVLDNFEQVLQAAALVHGFLEAAPDLRVLVTSRAPLRIAGEQEWEVQPLDPDSAFRIFVQRATAVR